MKIRHVLFILLIIIITNFEGVAVAVPSLTLSHTLLIVHSYAMDYEWTSGQDAGIMKAFDEKYAADSSWNIEKIYLDAKKKSENPDLLKAEIENVKKKILMIKPDAVIITDDIALQSLFSFLQKLKIPISFSGINGDIREYGYHEGLAGVTGSLEQYNFPAVAKLIKSIQPEINRIVFIGDESLSTDGIFSDIKKQWKHDELAQSGLKNYQLYKSTSFSSLKKFLKSLDPQRDGIFFVAFYTYKDDQGNPVDYREIDKWVLRNTAFVDAGVASFHVKNGRLLSLASSAEETGYYCATILFDALHDEKDPGSIPIRIHLPLKLMINHDRAAQLLLSIPFEILSYAANSQDLLRQKSVIIVPETVRTHAP